MKLPRATLAVLIGVGLATSCGDPTNEGELGYVQGIVRDTETQVPLAGAAVTIAQRTALSGSDGFYNVEGVSPGTQPISVKLEGYLTYEAQVEVDPGDGVLFDVSLRSASVPTRPGGLRAIATNDPPNVIDVQWSTTAGAISYNLYWATAPGVTPTTGTRIEVSPGPFSQGYSHTGLAAGTTYYYVVTGVNELGESEPSAEAGATAGSGITIVRGLPPAGHVVNDRFDVALRFSSTFQIVSVSVTLAGRTTNLALSGELWMGTLDLSGLSRGSYPLGITATDGQGHSGLTTVGVLLDRPPTLDVTLPLDGTVAQGSVEVSVTCVDDDPAGCQQTRAIVNDALLLVGTGSISGTVPLARGVDETVTLVGVDRVNQTGLKQRAIIVEPSSRLTPVSAGGSGIVFGADATRLLVAEFDYATFPFNARLRVRDRASSADAILTGNAVGMGAMLVDGGVVFDDPGLGLFLWRSGAPPIHLPTPLSSITTAGPFFAYQTSNGLERRNATTGSAVIVTGESTSGSAAVGNGDVVYGTNGGVFRFTDPGTSPLDTDVGVTFIPLSADETSAVVVKQFAFNRFALALYDAAGETSLSGEESESFDYYPAVIAGGWSAFSRLTSGLRQVWLRSPAGEERQLSFFSQPASVEGVSPAGDVLFLVSDPAGTEGRYLVRAGGTAELISRQHGRGLFIDGVPHVALGNTLFRVQ